MKGADCRLGTGAGTWVVGGETGDGGGGGEGGSERALWEGLSNLILRLVRNALNH